MHPTHNKALSSAYDVDLIRMIQIDDLYEGDAAYLRCGLLLNQTRTCLSKWKQAPFWPVAMPFFK
jgi:hypothetical protein